MGDSPLWGWRRSCSAHHIGVLSSAKKKVPAMRPERKSDGACFAIGRVVGQFVGLTERFAGMSCANAAGKVRLPLNNIQPKLRHRVAGQRQVCQSRRRPSSPTLCRNEWPRNTTRLRLLWRTEVVIARVDSKHGRTIDLALGSHSWGHGSRSAAFSHGGRISRGHVDGRCCVSGNPNAQE